MSCVRVRRWAVVMCVRVCEEVVLGGDIWGGRGVGGGEAGGGGRGRVLPTSLGQLGEAPTPLLHTRARVRWLSESVVSTALSFSLSSLMISATLRRGTNRTFLALCPTPDPSLPSTPHSPPSPRHGPVPATCLTRLMGPVALLTVWWQVPWMDQGTRQSVQACWGSCLPCRIRSRCVWGVGRGGGGGW